MDSDRTPAPDDKEIAEIRERALRLTNYEDYPSREWGYNLREYAASDIHTLLRREAAMKARMQPLVDWAEKVSASHATCGSAIIHGCQCGLCKIVRRITPPSSTAGECEHKLVQVSVADGKVDPGGYCIKCGQDFPTDNGGENG